jgi:hypothetical protein
MKHALELLQMESRRAALSNDEREALRESLMSYIDKHPVEAESETPAKSKKKLSKQITKRGSLSPKLLSVAVVLVGLMTAGGLVYASGKSVPGEGLYRVKGINEKVKRSLALSDESRIKVEIALAKERLLEAEKLERNNRLYGNIKTRLHNDFDHHVKTATDNIKALIQQNKISEAMNYNLSLAAVVSSHQAIIGFLKSEQ